MTDGKKEMRQHKKTEARKVTARQAWETDKQNNTNSTTVCGYDKRGGRKENGIARKETEEDEG